MKTYENVVLFVPSVVSGQASVAPQHASECVRPSDPGAANGIVKAYVLVRGSYENA